MFFQRKDVKEQKIEELLLENYNRYYRLAYSYVHNEADAADIVQNGAYKAIRNSDSLKNVEETGQVSLASGGKLYRRIDADTLEMRWRQIARRNSEDGRKKWWKGRKKNEE